MKCLVALTPLFLMVMFCGCGDSLPTEHAGEQFLRQEVAKAGQRVSSEQLMTLVTFHKTNGQMGRNYIMEYEGEIEFTKDCFWQGGLSVRREHTVYLDFQGRDTSGFSPVKKGQRGKISGKIQFEKTEKGWRPDWVRDK